MSNTGKLQTDPLFVGLTRPPMFLGVSYLYMILNLMVSALYFINSSDFRVVLVSCAVHLVGYLISYKEPLFMEIIRIRFEKCNRCRNRFFHGANSYDVY